jgi:hypothetical protein
MGHDPGIEFGRSCMTPDYIGRYPELSLSSLDPAVWKTIPEIAVLTRCLAGDIGTVLAYFGLRWKGPNGRWTNHYATEKALRDGFAVRVDL